MRWTEALKIYNRTKKDVNPSHVWVVPRKGTPEHKDVMNIIINARPASVAARNEERRVRALEQLRGVEAAAKARMDAAMAARAARAAAPSVRERVEAIEERVAPKPVKVRRKAAAKSDVAVPDYKGLSDKMLEFAYAYLRYLSENTDPYGEIDGSDKEYYELVGKRKYKKTGIRVDGERGIIKYLKSKPDLGDMIKDPKEKKEIKEYLSEVINYINGVARTSIDEKKYVSRDDLKKISPSDADTEAVRKRIRDDSYTMFGGVKIPKFGRFG
jgi:hypothetical protein